MSKEVGYLLPLPSKLTKKRLREIKIATERQCRNGGKFDRPGICAADLLSLIEMLEEERKARREETADFTGVAGKR